MKSDSIDLTTVRVGSGSEDVVDVSPQGHGQGGQGRVFDLKARSELRVEYVDNTAAAGRTSGGASASASASGAGAGAGAGAGGGGGSNEKGKEDEGTGGRVLLKLLSGTCEVFGTEVAQGQQVDVTGQNVALFTYHGARIQVKGKVRTQSNATSNGDGDDQDEGGQASDTGDGFCAFVYTVSSDETPVMQYANVHSVLQKRREGGGGGGGPRCLVAGPVDVGKSTLTKILTNYAVRSGFTPLLIDLDIGQGMITVPGTLSCVLVEDVAEINSGTFSQNNALSFFYGHASPSENINYYKVLVERMATIVDTFLESNSASKASSSGIFVNTMGWIDGQGLELLMHAIEKLKIDTVLVVGHDRLCSQLKATFHAEGGPDIVKVTKSDGVVSRDSSYRKLTRERKVHSYFYGFRRELSPFSRSIQISQIHVYRVGGGFKAPLSALPIGTEKREDATMKVTKVSVQRDLTHSLLAVSYAKTPEDIIHANVAGFIHVTEVDVQKGVLVYLSPSPEPLPTPILVTGTIKCFLK